MIYLDNSATTKPYPEVLETYQTVAASYFANPSSLHSKGGEAERLLTRAHEMAAQQLDVRPDEVVFTSGGSESNNLAIKGTAFYYQSRGRHLITTDAEHASTEEAFRQLEGFGFEVTRLPAREEGRIAIADLKKAIRPDTTLVSMIHVNNELGTVQPVEEAGALLRAFPTVHFHVDHVQGATKVPLDMGGAGVDLCTLSGHKFHGPRGVGILYIRAGIEISPLISGGAHEGGRRAGTENVPAIVAMVKALRMSMDQSSEGIAHLRQLQARLCDGLRRMDGVRVNTPEKHVAPHLVNFSVQDLKPEILIHALEERGIYVSSKSACSSKEDGPSRVLLAAGVRPEDAQAAIRISLAFSNQEKEITETLEALREIIPRQQRMEGAH